MRAAISKAEIESTIAARFGDAFKHHETKRGEVVATGIPEIDALAGGGLPRGAITEIFGPASSGRTSFMLAMLAHAIANKEVCTLIDTSDCFDPVSSGETQVDLDQLLWVRCAANVEHAFKATDLLLQGGGFGLVLLDLGDIAGKDARRIISSWWYRFRRTVENTPTALVVIAADSCVRSCASLALEMNRDADSWSSPAQVLHANLIPPRPSEITHANLLRGIRVRLDRHRPLHSSPRTAQFNGILNNI